MRSFFLLLSLTTAAIIAKAQTVTGKITDIESRPLTGISVSLLKASDSALVKMYITSKEGLYRFDDIAPGNYLLLATSVGYTKIFSPVFEHTTESRQDVVLEKENVQMEGIIVTATKLPVEVKAGKTVVNVDASPTNAGLNVLEILEKSPGVTVDNDGNVSLKGKGGVMILIDGKPTYLSGTQLAALLKSIQASGLSQIEIMTNPPAKYDAAGNSGIINIKTKKGAIRGMNGNIDLSYAQGLYPKFNGGGNINYRNNKVNVFGSYNGGQWESTGTLYLKRRFYKEGNISGYSDQQTKRHNKSNWHNAKLGLDYYFTDKDVAGIVVTGNMNPWNNQQNSISNLKDVNQVINSTFISEALNANRSSNINTNINYKHSFDSLGKELTVDLDQGYYESKGNNLLTTRVYNADDTQRGNTVLLDGKFPSVINIYSGKADYVHPFSKELKLEAGIKSSFVNTDNEVIYIRDTSTGWKPDNVRSNHFLYKENINAAYAIFSATLKKWELSAGLRMENTIAEGKQVKTDSGFTRKYTNLFPNAGLSYTISDKNQLSLAYSRRIRRPDYDDLNPFIFFLDSLTYGQGNPYLQPQFSNNIELSHTFNRFLTTTVNYTQTDDIITEILKQDNEKKTAFQTKENFSKMKQWGLTVTANKQLKKWWNMNVYLNGFHNHFNGLYMNEAGNIPVEINVTGFMGNMSNSFVFAKTWTAELSGWYASRMSEGLMIGKQMGGLNAAIAKKVWNNKGTFKLGVRDLLRTNNFSAVSRYADVDIDVYNDRKIDSRQINFSFSYKFGKNGATPARRRTGGAGDEQSRIGSGGN